MLCAACGDPTETSPCAHCGAAPELNARYQLLSRLGSEDGATGVFLAHDLREDRKVTVKERVFASGRDLKDWELFDREWQVLSQLRHPQVPRYVDHFEQGEGRRLALYIVVEHVEGESLRQELDRTRGTAREAVQTVIEVLQIVDDLHRLTPPVIHRDIKPANLIRGEDGALFLIDFGSVRAALQPTEGITVVGTFGYMAPEQLQGDASPASDLYACGAMLVAILTREDPARMLGVGRRGWLEQVSISAELIAVIEQLTQHDPAHRFASARAAIEALEATPEITGAPSTALVPTAPRSAARATPDAAPARREPLDRAERAHAEALAASIVRGPPSQRHQERQLRRILEDPGIPIERRHLVQSYARQRLAELQRARVDGDHIRGALAMIGVGVVVPILTAAYFGMKAWSHFGWFATMVPIGVAILLTRGLSRAKRRGTRRPAALPAEASDPGPYEL